MALTSAASGAAAPAPERIAPARAGDKAAGWALAGLVALLLGAAGFTNIPQFWGDGATYHAMAWSLAEDLDLRYEPRDILRIRREFPTGPQGLFLKRSTGGLTIGGGFPWVRRISEEVEPRPIYYAKPFAYSVVAAPFVRAFGTRGLFVTNALFLGLALVLGYLVLRRQASPGRALAVTIALFLLTVTPVYLVWPAPEVFNLGLVAAGLAAWRLGRPTASALLLGVAIYSKPYNLWLAIPLGLAPLLGLEGTPVANASAEPFGRRLLEGLRRAAVTAATTVLLFGLNMAVTGEWNYQGGRERKTFYGHFPFEMKDGNEVTFGNSGIWMSTNQLGPRVEGRDEAPPAQGAEPPRSRQELRASFVRSLGYFWVGRFGGVVPYFLPFAAAVVVFLVAGPRAPPGWLALLALVVSQLFYVDRIPDNWYGGSGTIGNRYFLNLLPLALFMVPRGRERAIAAAGVLGAAVFTGPLLADPLGHSLRPGRHAMQGAYRHLPAELTMLNDLSIFSERWRWKRPYGDTEGDPHRHWPADPKAYYLYFPDDGTHGKESLGGVEGFWLRGGRTAEVFLRALEPVEAIRLKVTGGAAGDEVSVEAGAGGQTLALAPGEAREVSLRPGPPFVYKDSFVHVLRFRSRRSGRAPTPDGSQLRVLGAFVELRLDVRKRPHGAAPSAPIPLAVQGRVRVPGTRLGRRPDRCFTLLGAGKPEMELVDAAASNSGEGPYGHVSTAFPSR